MLRLVIVLFSLLITALENNNKVSGSLQSLLYSNYLTCEHNRSLNLDISETKIYFYDFQNNFNASYKINDASESLVSYNLNVTRKLIFYVMGYEANITWSLSDTMRNSFQNKPNVYLIIVDYSALRHKGGKRDFENSIMHSYYVGEALGRFLTELHDWGILSRNIHCVGSSLGAQILGHAGITYMERTREKIWRITGLDPAGPCFANSDVGNQLRSGLADYVEVYHCNAGVLGTSSILADIDVFLNDEGRTQPHCNESGFEEIEIAQCSHQACLTYWMRTVEHCGWLALECNSYENFIEGKCLGNKVTTLGYNNSGNATGVFYATTETYIHAKK